MKKLFLTLYFLSSTILYAKIEVLDRIAVIVDDGVIMESQITKTLADVSKRYDCLLYTSPSPRDYAASRMPSSA